MIKKTVICEDFNGNEIQEDCYFNLTEAEVVEMNASRYGSMKELLEGIIQEKNLKGLVEHFKYIVLRAYGEKTLDGRHFMKSEEIRNRFECSAAYSKIFMELATDDKAAAEFINGIMPKFDEKPSLRIEK